MSSEEKLVFTDLSANEGADFNPTGWMISDLERALVLRAINTERNNLVHWYGLRVDSYGTLDEDSKGLLSGYSDKPWGFVEGSSWEVQITALNRFEARLMGCKCCFNNAGDFEHYHSPVCSPNFREIEIIPDTTNVFARHAETNPNAF